MELNVLLTVTCVHRHDGFTIGCERITSLATFLALLCYCWLVGWLLRLWTSSSSDIWSLESWEIWA